MRKTNEDSVEGSERSEKGCKIRKGMQAFATVELGTGIRPCPCSCAFKKEDLGVEFALPVRSSIPADLSPHEAENESSYEMLGIMLASMMFCKPPSVVWLCPNVFQVSNANEDEPQCRGKRDPLGGRTWQTAHVNSATDTH